MLQKFTSRPPLKPLWLLLLLLVLFMPHLYVSYSWYAQSFSGDLHLRVVGSRLLAEGKSPYFYSWMPGDNPLIFEPNIFLPDGLNGVTLTPFALWLQLPLLKLNYCSIRLVWWLLQEFMLFGALCFTCLVPRKFLKQIATAALATGFFCYSRNWWLNVYTGQYYIIFGFVFSLVAYINIKKKNSIAAFILFPVTSLIRPFFALAALPMIIKNLKKNWGALAIGITITLGLFFISCSISTWKDYNNAMKLYSTHITGEIVPKVATDNRFANVPLEPCLDRTPSTRPQGFLEAGCILSMQHYLKLFHIKKSDPTFFTALLLAAIFLLLLITKRKHWSTEQALLISFLIYMLCEVFTPAYRNAYNVIQYAGIIGVFVDRANWKLILLATLGLCLNHDLPFRMAYQRELGEGLLLLAIFLCVMQRKLETRASQSVRGTSQIALVD